MLEKCYCHCLVFLDQSFRFVRLFFLSAEIMGKSASSLTCEEGDKDSFNLLIAM